MMMTTTVKVNATLSGGGPPKGEVMKAGDANIGDHILINHSYYDDYAGRTISAGSVVEVIDMWPKIRISGNGFYYYIPFDWEVIRIKAGTPSRIKERKEVILSEFQTGKNGHAKSGSDPEVFVVDKDGAVIPAFKFLKSQKDHSRSVSHYYDGYQAEFNVEPRACHDELLARFRGELASLFNAVQMHNPRAELSWKPLLEVPAASLREDAEEFTSLGCSPSYNVYEDEKQLVVDNPRELPFRFAGCHHHFGDERFLLIKADVKKAIKAMDAFSGVIMTSVLAGMDDPLRRKFYGKAGEYRTPAHGIEWRTPSSAVLAHPTLTYLSFDSARYGMVMALRGLDSIWKVEERRVRDIINSCDFEEARKVLKENMNALKRFVGILYFGGSNPTREAEHGMSAVLDLIMDGALNVLPIEDGMEKNWGLRLPSNNTDWAITHYQVKHVGREHEFWKKTNWDIKAMNGLV